jgi:DNA-binding CsgD family transcriptional regulator
LGSQPWVVLHHPEPRVSQAGRAAARHRSTTTEIHTQRGLAPELHDSAAQTLTRMLLDIARFKTDQIGRRSALEQLDALETSTSQVLAGLLKDSQSEAFVSAVPIRSGDGVMTPTAAGVLNPMIGTRQSDGLTRREVEILILLAQGLTNKQIAYRLKISDKTVRNHVSTFYTKLGVRDRAHAVLYAVKKGLVKA